MKKIMILLFVSLFSFSVNSNAKSITLGWAQPNVIDLALEFTEKENRDTNNKIIIFFIFFPLLLLLLLI